MSPQPAIRIDLRAPVIALLLAATAVPVGLRPPVEFSHSFGVYDCLQNIAGYLPLGLVLGRVRWTRALAVAAGLSLSAEFLQRVMLLRDPSLVDVAANIIGAALGIGFAKALGIRPTLKLRAWMAAPAGLIAVGLAWLAIAEANPMLNPRGSTAAGKLEANWRFEEPDGLLVKDSGPSGLNGTLHGKAKRVPGREGKALSLDGNGDYALIRDTVEFRMTGSLTVSAWIKVRKNPEDDAVIVSDLDGDGPFSTGFQLDTTVDTGPRTVGFKLGDACGRYFARYGATSLQADRWYFVTGTYDARARTADVYLDGNLDNGKQKGVVPDSRRYSRKPLRIGRRTESDLFDFSGLIDDVKLYSRSMSGAEVAAAHAGADPRTTAPNPTDARTTPENAPAPFRCEPLSDPRGAKAEEVRLPTVVASIGAFLSLAILALFPRRMGPPSALMSGAISGYVVLHFATFALHAMNSWTFPLTGTLAALSVVASRQAAQ